MTSLKKKRVLIFQQRGWGKIIGRFLAKKLYDEGCQLAALTFKRSTHNLIVEQPNAYYELIINHDEFFNDPYKYLGEDDFTLEEICRDLGIDSVWSFMSVRNFVKTYQEKYYYSYRQNVPDEFIVAYIKAVYKCILIFFNDFKPDIIISPNFVSFSHIMFGLYAKKHNVPMISVATGSRIKNITVFTYSHYEDKGPFCKRIDLLNDKIEKSDNLNRAKKYIKEFRKKFTPPQYSTIFDIKRTWPQRLKYELYPFYYIIKWFIERPKNPWPNLGSTLDYKTPRVMLRDHYAQKLYVRFANRFPYYPFEKIKKFIYFPLQFQPEASLEVAAPYFANQIETARQIAMSLPGDYTLVVKEHPRMIGLRPPSYIKKLARIPNVKLIDYRTSSPEILKKSDLIVSPSGTSIVEAAFYYKPVIQLGNMGTTLKLPNVVKHTDMTTLSAKIKELLKQSFDTFEYERRLENYISAAYDVGLEFNYHGVWERGERGDMESLWQFYKKEIIAHA